MRKRTPAKRRSGCPISFTLDTFGDKWALLIIRDLMFKGKRNYGEFLQSEEGIATNILSDRLKRLEEVGIVLKEVDPDNRRKFVYRLADKGVDLLPLLLEMILWGSKHDPKTEAPKEFIRRLERDREGVLRELRKRLRRS